MIVLEGDKPLGDDAHRFYDDMVAKLKADTRHVEHIQDFWGDPLTRAGAQSDGSSITCRITVDGVLKDERTTNGVNAQTFCLVKSA